MLLFRVFFWCWKPLLKLGRTNFKRKTFSCKWKPFSSTFLPEQAVFPYRGNVFFQWMRHFELWKRIFWLVQTIFCIFFERLLSEKAFFLSSANKSFIPAIGEGYFSLMKTVTSLENFLLAETVTAMNGNQFLKTQTYSCC